MQGPGFRSLIALACVCFLGLASAWAQNANDGFDPNANDNVQALAVQPDGKILVGGSFTSIAGSTHTRLARLLPDGTADAGFANTEIDNVVRSLAIQADGRIVVAGDFTHVAALERNYIARLNADGSIDSTFDPNANNPVATLAVQPDGKILLGGFFTTLVGGATERNYIARLNVDGSVDSMFDPNMNSYVNALAVQADGKILLGGGFTALAGGITTRNGIARLNTNGSVDSTFNPNANNPVLALAAQSDGKILLGGGFTALAGGVTTRKFVARLNADGSVDSTFNPKTNGQVDALAVQPDGKILLGGGFTALAGGVTTRKFVARLNADGSVDSTFNPNADNPVLALAVQPDGKILLGGVFTFLAGGATERNHIARLYADGSVDGTFNPKPDGGVAALAVQPDGKILLGGEFTTLAGGASARNGIARLNADGSVDSTFDPNANGYIFALAVQRDGKILLGGDFTTLTGGVTAHNYIARLNADGSIDSTFNQTAINAVAMLAVQPDGKILIGGSFMIVAGGATEHNFIARLNADGSVDSTFNPDVDNPVSAVALQPDGKILLGGSFRAVAGRTIGRGCIARFNADGSLDSTFDPDANNPVLALAVQPDGKILLGGLFTALAGGATRNRIARLNADGSVDSTFDPNANSDIDQLVLQPDGKILLGGFFTTLAGGAIERNHIARLNADGSVDSTFDPSANNANNFVDAFAVLPDGRILLGGNFTGLAGDTTRNYIARLSTPDAALQAIAINGSTVTWLRSGAGPELTLPPTLEFSVSGDLYAPVGTLSRIPGGWRGGSVTQPVGQTFYLRVRGPVSSGGSDVNGSQGLVESVRQLFGNDRVFADGFE